jgi:hypothetical protein
MNDLQVLIVKLGGMSGAGAVSETTKANAWERPPLPVSTASIASVFGNGE